MILIKNDEELKKMSKNISNYNTESSNKFARIDDEKHHHFIKIKKLVVLIRKFKAVVP